jgi:hypothetical protein
MNSVLGSFVDILEGPDFWELVFVGLVAAAAAWLWKHPNR